MMVGRPINCGRFKGKRVCQDSYSRQLKVTLRKLESLCFYYFPTEPHTHALTFKTSHPHLSLPRWPTSPCLLPSLLLHQLGLLSPTENTATLYPHPLSDKEKKVNQQNDRVWDHPIRINCLHVIHRNCLLQLLQKPSLTESLQIHLFFRQYENQLRCRKGEKEEAESHTQIPFFFFFLSFFFFFGHWLRI